MNGLCGSHTGLALSGFAALISLGLAGSLHCVGMCAPLSCLFVTGGTMGWRGLALYHVARLFSYAGLGALLWHLGQPLRLNLPWPWLAALVSLPLLAYGLFPSIDPPSALARLHRSAYRAMQTLPAGLRAAGLGLLTPLLPCGLLYAAAGYSLAAPTPALAAAWMAAFAAGTLPLLVAAQLGWRSLTAHLTAPRALMLRRGSALFAGVTVLAFALM